MRKDMGLEVLDKIGIAVEKDGEWVTNSLVAFKEYICSETQALNLEFKDKVDNATEVELDEFKVVVRINKV
jgi:isoleucyl-tRNA synthetase